MRLRGRCSPDGRESDDDWGGRDEAGGRGEGVCERGCGRGGGGVGGKDEGCGGDYVQRWDEECGGGDEEGGGEEGCGRYGEFLFGEWCCSFVLDFMLLHFDYRVCDLYLYLYSDRISHRTLLCSIVSLTPLPPRSAYILTASPSA